VRRVGLRVCLCVCVWVGLCGLGLVVPGLPVLVQETCGFGEDVLCGSCEGVVKGGGIGFVVCYW